MEESIDTIEVAKNAIYTFLEQLNVKHFAYIDDRFDIEHEKGSFIGFLKSCYHSSAKQDQFDNIDWSLPEPVFNSAIEKIWNDSDQEQKRKLLLKYKQVSGESDELENSVPALKIENDLPGMIQTFTPNEWMEKKDDLLTDLQGNQSILCLFDINLDNGSTDFGRDGIDLAQEVLKGKYSDQVYCGLFSHTFSIEEEGMKRKQFHEERGLEFNQFYTISKKRYSQEPTISGFAEGIKNALTITVIEDLKAKSISIIDSSIERVKTFLQGMTPETFNHVVQKSSEAEGVWEVDTFFRLANIMIDVEFKKTISDKEKRNHFIAGIDKIRQIERIPTGADTPFNNSEAKGIRYNELYYTGDTINKLHHPITNGDIFLINGKEHILLVQPCNLSIRTTGKRQPETITGILVEIKLTPENIDKLPYEYLKVREFLDDSKEKILDFPTYKTIDLDFLDLCVFNEGGSASIALKTEKTNSEKLLQDPMKKHFAKIRDKFLKLENQYIAFEEINHEQKISKESKTIIKNIRPPFSMNNSVKGLPEKPYDKEERLFDFGIKRVRRIKSPYSDDLLQKFMLYLSRNGFDYDFSTPLH